ncbi:MAG TPA: hypothetical protein VIC29_15590 [Steroidobacteraceae bacterium]|jgi:hypothetical protein
MIAQIWRGRTRAEDRHDFTRLLQERMRTEAAISQACRGAYVLQRELEEGEAESLVLTLYDQGAPVPPSQPAEEAALLVSCDLTPTQYEVVADPRRGLLYASLRRRFPLRIATPR